MKKQFALIALFAAMTLPQLVQAQQIRLSLSDQQRFDSYYSRWRSYKATNNQGEIRSMEGRMQDVYQHYGIPAGTPYGRVASGGGGIWRTPPSSGGPSQPVAPNGTRDPFRHHSREWERDHARYEHHEWVREREREEERHDRGLHRGWDKDHDHDHDRHDDHDRDRHDHHESKGSNGQDHKAAARDNREHQR